MERAKQDKKLDGLSKGLNQLKEIGTTMREEIDRQNPYVVVIEEKVDEASEQLRSNNQRLTTLVTSVRSQRKFCVDLILIFVLLGVASYIVSIVQKK
jgi:syntaxin of plants SYP7